MMQGDLNDRWSKLSMCCIHKKKKKEQKELHI